MSEKICVIGLGYVGLPVAVALSKHYETFGVDVNPDRIAELKESIDHTKEVSSEELSQAKISYSSVLADAKEATFFIITVPTPIDINHRPDFSYLYSATRAVAAVFKKGDCIVYESTVYPGATRDRCIPLIEKATGMKAGVDFYYGYSPERINPGDKEHRFETILKVVSGNNQEALDRVDVVYSKAVTAGTFRAASVEVAEAAKVIENTQRDLNVALINELAMIFDRLDIDTRDVLEAAGTKWNFLKFQPGIVGGHCIGVDPYYLTHRAEQVGYAPQVILSGRKVNLEMGSFIAQQTIKLLARRGVKLSGAKVSLMGVTFKENCPDIRNSRTFDIIAELEDYGVDVQLSDPQADADEVEKESGYRLTEFEDLQPAEAVIFAVSHKEYQELAPDKLMALFGESRLMIDVKAAFDRSKLKELGLDFWRL